MQSVYGRRKGEEQKKKKKKYATFHVVVPVVDKA